MANERKRGGFSTSSAAVSPPRRPWGTRGKERSYAGFIDRFSGLLLDGLIVALAQLPVLVLSYGLLFVAGLFVSTGTDCRYDPTSTLTVEQQFERCSSSGSWLFLAIAVFAVVLQFLVWWRLVPGRMSGWGASVGMSIAQIEIESYEGRMIGRWQAFGRALLAMLLPLVLALPPLLLLVLVDPDLSNGAGALVFVLLCLMAIGYALPWLWSLWDLRRQTLYDRFTATVVTGPPGPYEPFSVAAMGCGLLSAVGLVPLAPLAIVFGHMGVTRVRRSRGELKGRGPARVGQVYGYLVTVATVVVLILWWASG